MNNALGQSVQGLREVVIRHPTSPVSRVVVGVDGSPAAAAAVQWAAGEAGRQEVALRIVSAWDEPPDVPGDDNPDRVAATRVQKALTRVLARPHYPRRIACVTPRGKAGQALLNEARETDLLVLGLAVAGGANAPGRINRYCLQRGRGPLVFVAAVPSISPVSHPALLDAQLPG